jgi:hypothetical protein
LSKMSRPRLKPHTEKKPITPAAGGISSNLQSQRFGECRISLFRRFKRLGIHSIDAPPLTMSRTEGQGRLSGYRPLSSNLTQQRTLFSRPVPGGSDGPPPPPLQSARGSWVFLPATYAQGLLILL